MKKKIFWLLLFGVSSNMVISQELLNLSGGCNFSGENFVPQVYSFDSDSEAEQSLKRIMKYTGLPANFIIRAADVPNAQASSFGSTRYILYNQLFMMRVKNQTQTDWAAMSILAHEIGHHLSGHTLDNIGSRPNKELEADRFSGFVLAKMGATLEQSLIAMRTIANETATLTHPARSTRLVAITNGWRAAKDLEEIKESSNRKPAEENPQKIEISGKVNQAWAEHNVYEYGRIGMRIHINFDLFNMKNIRGHCAAYFYFENGTVLKDFNGLFSAQDGQVSVGTEILPVYENTTFTDFTLFMPYDELHMPKGKYDLKISIILFSKENENTPKQIVRFEYIHFIYTS